MLDRINPISRLHGADMRLASLGFSISQLADVVEVAPPQLSERDLFNLATQLYSFAAVVGALRGELAELRQVVARDRR